MLFKQLSIKKKQRFKSMQRDISYLVRTLPQRRTYLNRYRNAVQRHTDPVLASQVLKHSVMKTDPKLFEGLNEIFELFKDKKGGILLGFIVVGSFARGKSRGKDIDIRLVVDDSSPNTANRAHDLHNRLSVPLREKFGVPHESFQRMGFVNLGQEHLSKNKWPVLDQPWFFIGPTVNERRLYSIIKRRNFKR